jgi:hypothetical protein
MTTTVARPPRNGVDSPVLAKVALTVLDEFVAQTPGGTNSTPSQRATRRRKGLANYRLVRYADDWLLMVSGTREHAEDVRVQALTVLAPMGLRLSEEKTKITHIDEGLDFLGWRIQRHRKRGTNRYYVYTYPSRKALRAVSTQGKDHLPAERQPANASPDAQAQPSASRLVRLLSPRRLQRHLRLLGPLHLGPGSAMGQTQAPPDHGERHPPPLLQRRVVADHLRRRPVQPGKDAHHALPLPGNSHTDAMADHGMRAPQDHWDLWRARCLVTGTPGSGGDSGKPTGPTPAGRPESTSHVGCHRVGRFGP